MIDAGRKLQEESCQDMIVEIVEIDIMKSNETKKGDSI